MAKIVRKMEYEVNRSKCLTNRIQHFEDFLNIIKIIDKVIYCDSGPKMPSENSGHCLFQGFHGEMIIHNKQ